MGIAAVLLTTVSIAADSNAIVRPAAAQGSIAAPSAEASRPAAWAEPLALDGVPNLHRVSPFFFRSAQPERRGFSAIRKLGVTNDLSLRANHADEPLAGGTGLALHRIPINTWNIRERDVAKALRLLRRFERDGGVLLHCQHGADRTGLVSALYRVIYQRWSKVDAIAEMRAGHFGYHAVWGNIPAFIRNVDIERMRRLIGET